MPFLPSKKGGVWSNRKGDQQTAFGEQGKPASAQHGICDAMWILGYAVCLYKDGKDGRVYTHLKELPKD